MQELPEHLRSALNKIIDVFHRLTMKKIDLAESSQELGLILRQQNIDSLFSATCKIAKDLFEGNQLLYEGIMMASDLLASAKIPSQEPLFTNELSARFARLLQKKQEVEEEGKLLAEELSKLGITLKIGC